MATRRGASAPTQSPNHWNPLKGLYLRNALLLSQKEDSSYKASQELQTGANIEAVGLVVPTISPLNTQQKELKKRYSQGDALLLSRELTVLDNSTLFTQV